ncbi:hypothetical protein [uncultured Algibacter sp.]|uniref:hypothetical protein n=1 Tax=uncultured Algibacter sp. TaxID=298659 RepID=UPI0032166C26
MKAKWYISTLIIVTTLFGAVYQQQTSQPNQEIVLEFTNKTVTDNEAQVTIALIKNQLQVLGVEHIHVTQQVDGRLKITYFSHADITNIKKIFSKETGLALGNTSINKNSKSDFPQDSDTISFNLDIYEIQNGTDAHWGIDGINLLESKPESHYGFEPDFYLSYNNQELRRLNHIVKEAYNSNRHVILATDNISYIIPEVRAGPLS